jgi:hypothetical protein
MLKKLNDAQQKRLRKLEQSLKDSAVRGNLSSAKQITLEIQDILRPAGLETRLMQAKNWLFEAALEAGEVGYAISGFIGVQHKTAKNTRVYLEATALLAICHLRTKDLTAAQPLIDETFRLLKNIKSDGQRKKFEARLQACLEEEGLRAAVSDLDSKPLDIEKIHFEAMNVASTKSKKEIIALLGESTPPNAVLYLDKIRNATGNLLPYKEILSLPNSESHKQNEKVGEKVFRSLKRVIWKSLCDPENEIYKAWYTNGLKTLLDKKYITAAITGALAGINMGAYAVAVYMTAMIIKLGIDVYCDAYQPDSLMSTRDRKSAVKKPRSNTKKVLG